MAKMDILQKKYKNINFAEQPPEHDGVVPQEDVRLDEREEPSS